MDGKELESLIEKNKTDKKTYLSDESAGLITMRDPMILVHGDTYYLTGTQPPYRDGINEGIHLWSSKDLIHFTDHGLIFKRADMPENMWCRDRFWAPELFDGKDGWFYLTFNCKNKREKYYHTQGSGIARARNITGPYENMTPNDSLFGQRHSNDAHLFRDENGEVWLAANIASLGGQTLHKIDLLTGELEDFVFVGGVGKESEWDHIGVEGACIVKRHGLYFHWYSSWTNGYNAGVFLSENIRGPWVKSLQNPILKDNSVWHKAGHNHCFVGLDGNDYIIFHANLRASDGDDLERIFISRVEYFPDGSITLYPHLSFGD